MKTLNEHLSAIPSGKNLILLTSINYEERSVSAISEYCEWAQESSRYSQIGVLIFQARHGRVEPLERLKEKNLKFALGRARSLLLPEPKITEINYPDNFSPAQLQLVIAGHAEHLAHGSEVLIDVSVLPTKALLAVLEHVHDEGTARAHLSFRFAYTWPKRYPRAYNYHGGGDAILLQTQIPLHSIGKRRIRAVVVLGSQGFDARLVLEVLPRGAVCDLLVMIHPDFFAESVRVIVGSTVALSSPETHFQYFLSYDRCKELMLEAARDAISNECDTFLIANFCVKPVSIFGFEALKYFRDNTKQGAIADFVGLSSHHYGSVYSIGSTRTEII